MSKRDKDLNHVPAWPKRKVECAEYTKAVRAECHSRQSFVWAAADVDHLAQVAYDCNGMAIGYQDTLSGAAEGVEFYLFD